MPKGELSVSYPGTTPALLKDWTIDRKVREIREWLLENFTQELSADFDFSDWDNEDDLSEDSELSATSTRQILLDNFGLLLSAIELEKILEILNEEFDEDWVPSEDRVDVDEIDDDDLSFSSIDEVRAKIPTILQHVADIREALFPHLGHNNPPEDLRITAADLEHLNFLLLRASSVPDNPTDAQFALLDQLGQSALRIGGEITRYVAKKGDLFLGKAMESAGEATGKWAVRAIAVFYIGSAFSEFGRALLELIAK